MDTRQLEAEINTLAFTLAGKRRLLNSFRAPLRVPPEILSEILLHCVKDELEDRQPYFERSFRPHSWIRLTLVCHQWRKVALAAPRLWSTLIIGENPDMVGQILKRSRRCPLDIRIYTDMEGQFEQSQQVVFHELERVRRLEIIEGMKAWKPPDMGKKALTLRSVTFTHDQRTLRVQSWLQTPRTRFDVPNLLHLRIRRGVVNKHHCLLRPTLTRFYYGFAIGPNPESDLAAVLGVLVDLPLLEHLELERVSRIPPGFIILQLPATQTTNLLRLSYLRIASVDPVSCFELLRRMVIPSTARLVLELMNVDSRRDTSSLCQVLTAKLGGWHSGGHGAPQTLSTLSVNCMPRRRLIRGDEKEQRVRCWTAHLAVECFDARNGTKVEPPCLDITVRHSDTPPTCATFLQALPISAVRTLHLCAPTMDDSAWAECGHRLMHVQQLCFEQRRDVYDQFADVLAVRLCASVIDQLLGSGHGNALRPYIFPELQELYLMHFETPDSQQTPEGPSLREAYSRVFEDRKRAGAGPRRVVLSHGDKLDAGTVDEFAKYVEDVVYDNE